MKAMHLSEAQKLIRAECREIERILLAKNAAYGEFRPSAAARLLQGRSHSPLGPTPKLGPAAKRLGLNELLA
ncbi:MAG TPA: hypothetical protein VM223_05980 [Planctomycetota bacterium]|nr:hypothetical protein [Planctomycetota bacterium]